MNNSSDPVKNTVTTFFYVQNSLFIAFGWLAIAGNTLIILVISAVKNLRTKEFMLILGLAVADLLVGISYALAGGRRIYFAMKDLINTPVRAWDCLLVSNVIPMMLGEMLVAIMLAVIALDRCLAILMFKTYRLFGKRYTLGLVIVAYAWTIVSTVVGIVQTYQLPRVYDYTLVCILPFALTPDYMLYHENVQIVAGVISFFIFLVTIWGLWRNGKVFASNGDSSADAARMKRQVKVTKTLGIVIILTMSLVTAPAIFRAGVDYLSGGNTPSFIIIAYPALSITIPLTSGSNLFVYAWKYDKFRGAVKIFLQKCLFCWRQQEPTPVVEMTTTRI